MTWIDRKSCAEWEKEMMREVARSCHEKPIRIRREKWQKVDTKPRISKPSSKAICGNSVTIWNQSCYQISQPGLVTGQPLKPGTGNERNWDFRQKKLTLTFLVKINAFEHTEILLLRRAKSRYNITSFWNRWFFLSASPGHRPLANSAKWYRLWVTTYAIYSPKKKLPKPNTSEILQVKVLGVSLCLGELPSQILATAGKSNSGKAAALIRVVHMVGYLMTPIITG